MGGRQWIGGMTLYTATFPLARLDCVVRLIARRRGRVATCPVILELRMAHLFLNGLWKESTSLRKVPCGWKASSRFQEMLEG